MDWNWFFSSVAQSFAALVGIFAAFVITKVVSNQSDYTGKLARGRELAARSQELVERLKGRSFKWYSDRELESLLDTVESQARGGRDDGEASPSAIYRKYQFPMFVPRSKVLSQIELRLAIAKEPERPGPYGIDRFMVKANLSRQLEAEGEKIDELVIEARHASRVVAQWLADVEGDPEKSPLIRFSIWAALLLFYGGVIYPLSFLPLKIGEIPEISLAGFWPTLPSLRGGLLAFPAALFTGICAVFLKINAGLRYPGALLGELGRFAFVENYSPYLKIMAENEREESRDLT